MQVNVEKYHEWIQLVAELTVSSLNSWQWASNSVYYLLGLWSRLVSSMPYLKGESPSLLETYVPKITEAYLTSRSDSYSIPEPVCLRTWTDNAEDNWRGALAHMVLCDMCRDRACKCVPPCIQRASSEMCARLGCAHES